MGRIEIRPICIYHQGVFRLKNRNNSSLNSDARTGKTAMFITLEGTDGSGKSTAARGVKAALTEKGYDVLLTREPGGTSIGDQVRDVVLNRLDNTMMHPHTELLLFCASRAQLVHEVIMPFLAQGGIVVCDRYADSTLAYQGYGHGLKLKDLRRILDFATGGLVPDMTLYLDLKPAIGLERRRKAQLFQGDDMDRLDAMKLAFHERVYAGYEALMGEAPKRWARIDAAQTPDKVVAAALKCLKPHLPKKPKKGAKKGKKA
jgi:dTMP kinase